MAEHGINLEQWAAGLRQEAAPVLIGSALGRSGTTAVQRLLNASGAVAVYGEDGTVVDIAVQTQRGVSRLLRNRDDFARQRAHVRDNVWQRASTPEPVAYAGTLLHMFFALARCYQRDAEALGSRQWGLKLPRRGLGDLLCVRQFLPRARVVYIRRDVADCLASYKAYCRDKPVDAHAVCNDWATNMREWQANRGHCLTVEFSRLEREPAAVVSELSTHLSLDLDASVLAERINVEGGYRPPEPLTDEERRLCDAARTAAEGGLSPCRISTA